MNAEPVAGDADYPNLLTHADDGTPLPNYRGWSCALCGTLYAEKDAAELCCMEPDAVAIGPLPALHLDDGMAKT